ncbi:Vng6109h (plasmid) [Halobacterium salinarum NRC-1]|uniref:Spurious ORF n=1 Tax=Halobacterium salinarum (strain ATCC 700922 / JCM 11081 / NRC-1) TaxID=64091 RepID=Q9HI12_HALSA|nr:Vng6109h [Halobacterium salinarum NRC-1]DAC79760.1 TPA_inf: spurious ORF [Halobacterium salinarum NRC-1]
MNDSTSYSVHLVEDCILPPSVVLMNLEDLYSPVGNRIGLAYREMMTEISVDEETTWISVSST